MRPFGGRTEAGSRLTTRPDVVLPEPAETRRSPDAQPQARAVPFSDREARVTGRKTPCDAGTGIGLVAALDVAERDRLELFLGSDQF